MPRYRITLSDGRIVTVDAAQPPTETDVLAAIQQPSSTAPTQPPPGTASIGSAIADALPNVGGMIGSAVGGVPGSALGGAAGVGFQQLARHTGEIPGALRDVARNLIAQPEATVRGAMQGMASGAAEASSGGAVQGAIEGVTRGVVTPAAKGLYGLALRPIKGMRDKYGLANLVREGFEHRVMPTAGGAKKAMKLTGESKAAQSGMADAYDAAGGAPLSTVSAAREGLRPILKKEAAKEAATGVPSHAGAVRAAAKSVTSTRPAVPAATMHGMKQAADEVADPAFAAARRTGVSVPDASEAGIAKGWTKGYRKTLDDALGPEYAAQGRKTKTLYGLAKAAERIGGEPHVLTNVAAGAVGAGSAGLNGGDIGGAAKNAILFRALMSPRAQALASFAATPIARYGIRATDALAGSPMEQLLRRALIAQMAGDGDAGER